MMLGVEKVLIGAGPVPSIGCWYATGSADAVEYTTGAWGAAAVSLISPISIGAGIVIDIGAIVERGVEAGIMLGIMAGKVPSPTIPSTVAFFFFFLFFRLRFSCS